MKKLFTYLSELSISALITFAVVSCDSVYIKTDKLIQKEYLKINSSKKQFNEKIDKITKEKSELESKLQTKSEEINKLKIDLNKIKKSLVKKPSILDVDAAELAISIARFTTTLQICNQEKNELIKLIKEQEEKNTNLNAEKSDLKNNLKIN